MMIIILVKNCETLGASRYLKVFLFFLQVFKEPFYITDLLQRAKAVLSKNDLLLMVFLPLDFALPIEGTVKYPYHNCDFRPFVIRNRNESSPGHHFTFA